MASTYTSRFKLEKMETGANANTWGTNTNNNLDVLDAFGGCDPSADFRVDSTNGGVIRVSRNSASTSNYIAIESDGTNGTVKAIQELIITLP